MSLQSTMGFCWSSGSQICQSNELAVCKGTSAILKVSARLPLARLGAPRAPRELLARGGTRRKIHFLSFLWMCRAPSTDTAPSET